MGAVRHVTRFGVEHVMVAHRLIRDVPRAVQVTPVDPVRDPMEVTADLRRMIPLIGFAAEERRMLRGSRWPLVAVAAAHPLPESVPPLVPVEQLQRESVRHRISVKLLHTAPLSGIG